MLGWMLVVVLACVPLWAQATVWSADNLQMVHLQDRERYVCDPDGVMSQALRDTADHYLRRLQVRMLPEGGRGVETYFMTDSASAALVARSKGKEHPKQ